MTKIYVTLIPFYKKYNIFYKKRQILLGLSKKYCHAELVSASTLYLVL